MTAYTSNEIGFVKTSLDEVVASFIGWQEPIFGPLGWRFEAFELEQDPSTAVAELLPLAIAPPTRHLFVETASRWVAYLDNMTHGTDAGPVMSVMSERLQVPAARVVSARRGMEPEDARPAMLRASSRYSATMFEYHEPGRAGPLALFSADDGGRWTHGSCGGAAAGFPPSDISVDRLNPFTHQRLVSLLASLDIHPFETGWFGSRAVLVTKQRIGRSPIPSRFG